MKEPGKRTPDEDNQTRTGKMPPPKTKTDTDNNRASTERPQRATPLTVRRGELFGSGCIASLPSHAEKEKLGEAFINEEAEKLYRALNSPHCSGALTRSRDRGRFVCVTYKEEELPRSSQYENYAGKGASPSEVAPPHRRTLVLGDA